jgi:hypothetical protein
MRAEFSFWSCQISIFVLVSLRAEQLVISRPPKISPLALGFVKSARDSCCLPLVFVCVLRCVRTGCAPMFSASDVLVLVSAPKYFSLPEVRSAPARTRISLLRSSRPPQLQLFSHHADQFPFGLCAACLELGSRSHRHCASRRFLLSGCWFLSRGRHRTPGSRSRC